MGFQLLVFFFWYSALIFLNNFGLRHPQNYNKQTKYIL